jgi:hypothetical protein
LGYQNVKLRGIFSEFGKCMHAIKPGNWKPRMKKTVDLKYWEPETPHEKDAVKMLLYAVQINFPELEITCI